MGNWSDHRWNNERGRVPVVDVEANDMVHCIATALSNHHNGSFEQILRGADELGYSTPEVLAAVTVVMLPRGW